MTQEEDPRYLTEQLITYIGNKRALLPFILRGVELVRRELGREKLDCLDIFSGSGVVARCLKSCSRSLTVNDLELYAQVISRCYLANRSELDTALLETLHARLTSDTERALARLSAPQSVAASQGGALSQSGADTGAANPRGFAESGARLNTAAQSGAASQGGGTTQGGATQSGTKLAAGFISELYAPADSENIRAGERCFYTPYNANYIDIMRQEIARSVPQELQCYFIAPLLAQASVHANTAGIFKGFYKNSVTRIGQFGGNGRNALSRIRGNIRLPFPLFSRYECPVRIFREEANALAARPQLYAGLADGSFDLAYIDPPYNQHPYGSNYFMLNLIASYERPDGASLSRVSGIPNGWNRSAYNRRRAAAQAFAELAAALKAKFLLVSFNSEGFISRAEMTAILERVGAVRVLESPYNTFRGSRNLKNRGLHVNEYLFVVRKR